MEIADIQIRPLIAVLKRLPTTWFDIMRSKLKTHRNNYIQISMIQSKCLKVNSFIHSLTWRLLIRKFYAEHFRHLNPSP